MSQTQFREVRLVMQSQPTSDGDGVKIQRVAGFNNKYFSPFLMMDELKADDKKDYVGGFPPHPHRGIETLTYMMNGHFQHKDHMGNVGELRSGGAQWMAAGQGVIHSEMPIMEEGQLHGFQIWINQPARDKMQPAKYFDFQPESITEKSISEGNLLRLLAGDLKVNNQPIQGPLTDTGVPVSVADWKAEENCEISLTIPSQHNSMIYVYKGAVTVSGKSLQQSDFAILPASNKQGERLDEIRLHANSDSGLLIFVGEPINEPVVHYGPFVMNTMDEINQAINDYQSGKFHQY
ncbi:pirin family protein [Vibrio algivorus]|uniref:Pirin family protein n=1 Tax=Vibrio algivorus TaxID=1667024 RepID=A0A557P828_9VIBR|nr:pirin family protein [Vibrio algivorus]TVO36820.1 pirin family protein [Vibrio algivorus]GLT13630.1 putative quercetin 2,3-dioxygenase [Vibrio algivorus]